MKRILIILIGFLLFNISITAQETKTEKKPINAVVIPDKAVKNAPYSAEGITESIQTLVDGNKIKRTTKELLFRDSQGRTRRETESDFSNTTRKSINITDPIAGFNYYLNPVDKTVIRVSISASPRSAIVVNGSRPAGYSSKREDLGSKVIEGIETKGNRYTTTIAPGTIGNEKEIVNISESWYSPELRVTISSKRIDPAMGDYINQLKNIKREEPDSTLFEVPAGYKVIEQTSVTDRYFIVKEQ